jgi:LemA protein
MFGIVLLVVLVLAALWLVGQFNGLVGLRNQVSNAWSQIDVQLKRRADLIPNLVNTVKGVMKFEQDTLEKVMNARARALSATTVGERGAAEGELSQGLGRLLAVMENYPELKSNQNALQMQEELSATENKIGFARQFYNDVVMKFNTAQQVFDEHHRRHVQLQAVRVPAGARGRPRRTHGQPRHFVAQVPLTRTSARRSTSCRRTTGATRSCSSCCS